MKIKAISAICIAGACQLLALDADAYLYSAIGCGPSGGLCKWVSGMKMYRDRCSMPNGSHADWSYWNAGDQWDNIAAVMDWNWWYDTGCTIGHNSTSETATVVPSQIGNLNGLCTCWKHPFVNGWSECDVKLSNQLNYWNEDESFWNWNNANQGRVVALHEFGHAMGLDHDDAQFSVMRTFTPYPLNGGTDDHAEPYPDEASGVYNLYNNPNPLKANLFASAQKFASNQIQPTEGWGACTTINKCRGQTLPVTLSIGSNGSIAPLVYNARIFLNNSPSGYTGGYNLWTGTAQNPPGTFSTQTVSLPIPMNVPNGTYWILWQLDTSSQTSEFNEQDNAVHSCKTVNISC